MKKEHLVMICMMGLMIILCWATLNSTKRLREEVTALNNSVTTVRNDVIHTYNEVTAAREDSRWWTPGDMDVVESGTDQLTLKIGFYLREYREGSRVSFHYRDRGGDEPYISLEAKKGAAGYYYAILTLEPLAEPLWKMDVQKTTTVSSSGRETSQHVSVEEVSEGYQERRIEYYISVDDAGAIRAGEISYIDKQAVFYKLYGYLHSSIHFNNDLISIHLTAEEYSDAIYSLAKARLESFRRGEATERWELSESDKEPALLELHVEPVKDYDALQLVVTYSDGKSFTRVIHYH